MKSNKTWGWKHEDALHGKLDLSPILLLTQNEKKKKNPRSYMISSKTKYEHEFLLESFYSLYQAKTSLISAIWEPSAQMLVPQLITWNWSPFWGQPPPKQRSHEDFSSEQKIWAGNSRKHPQRNLKRCSIRKARIAC